MDASTTTGLDLEFQLLGPVRVRRAAVALDLGGSKPYGVLALLLLSANRPVPVSALIDGLWADDAPRTATKMIQVYVSRIRQQLGTHGSCLRTTPGGYQLNAEDASIDLLRFEQLTARAHAVASSDPAAAAELLAQALRLWQGPALANVRNEPFAEAAAVRLEELRIAALEARIDADLAAGRHRGLIAELQQLVATHPTREHLGGQLMLALYRSGRQAEALAAAKDLRGRLNEELGISPGPAIAQLEMAILRQESSLELAASSTERAPHVTKPAPTTARGAGGRRHWRRNAGLAAVAAAAGISLILGTAGSAPRQPAGPAKLGTVPIKPASLLVVDGTDASVVADLPLGGDPDRIAVADDSAWVSNRNLRTVTRIDLSSETVGETVGLATWPSNLAANDANLWISNGFAGTVTRLFTSSGQLTSPTYPDGDHSGLVILATDNRDLYTGLPDGRLVALALANLRVAAQTRLRDRVALLADAGSTLCAGYFRASAVDCLRTPKLSVRATMLLPTTALAVTCNATNAWALAGAPASIWHLDLTSRTAPTRHDIPPGATAIAASKTYLWILYGGRGELLRLPMDLAGPPVTLDIGRPAAAIATWRDEVIVTLT